MAIYLDQISATDIGILPSNTAAQNRSALLAELPNSNRHVVFPPGDYAVDNATEMDINNFSGRLLFAPGARFVFQTNTVGGIRFLGGNRAVLENLATSYQTTPTSRVVAAECIEFDGATDPTIINARIDLSPSAGILFKECIRPHVIGARITNTKADALHFNNCLSPVAVSINTDNTGDDGLAFVNYAVQANNQGGYASGITVKNSDARGISVVGQSDVVVEGFLVENTQWSGIYCAYEASYNTRTPSNVRFANGTIKSGGAKNPGNLQHGVTYGDVASLTIESVTVESPGSQGFYGVSPAGKVTIKDCRVNTTTGTSAGFNLGAQTLVIGGLVAQDCGGYGLFLNSSDPVEFDNLTAINTSKNNTLRRAIWFENNTRVDGSNLHVIDLQATPTGYIVGSYGTQTGGIGDISSIIPNGTLQIDNLSNLNLGTVDGRPTTRVSADRGDANVTLTMKDPPIQRFAAILTANRTVTLPSTGVYNGAVFRVVRTGLGAFTLNVGGLKTIPASTAAFVDVTHDGTAWRLTGYGLL